MRKNNVQKIAENTRKKAMSKKELREYNKSRRTLVMMNTGTQAHKSAKDYNRKNNIRTISIEISFA